MKKTKILATIGPASLDKKIITKMINSGMNAVRINTSHGDFDQYEKIIKLVRSVKNIPIIMDTQGPEIRIYCKKDHKVKSSETLEIGFNNNYPIYINKNIRDIKKNQLILLNDGVLKFKVLNVKKDSVHVAALSNSTIKNKMRINIPDFDLKSDILSSNDKKLLKWSIKNKIDYIALSYTRNAKDIEYVKNKLSGISLIAKIEDSQGVNNFDEILEASDGIMLARGDLGVEIDSEQLPIIQKKLIKKCNQKAKLVITATQMLQSMINHSTPTRAETSDVANAILDGTDVVMLSGETAIGKYPVLAVKEMTKIAKEVEPYVNNKVVINQSKKVSQAISKLIYETTQILPITKVITVTRTGYTAKIISRFRLKQNIIAITDDKDVKNKLELYYGVTSIVIPKIPDKKKILTCAKFLHKNKLIDDKDFLLFTAGVYVRGSTNLIEVHRADELLKN